MVRRGSPDGRAGVQQQARALGDPTRYGIFQRVAAADAPVTVAALTAEFRMNHNAVRQHLAKLCDAGLLVEEFGPRGRPGRPALLYRLAPGVAGRWDTTSPYEQLALYLLEIARTGRSPRDVGVEAGREAGRLAGSGTQPPADQLLAEMRRRGFEPRPVARTAVIEIVLDACPYATVAAQDPSMICELHRGIVEGFVDGAGGGLAFVGLQVRNPHQAGCRVTLKERSETIRRPPLR